MKRLAAGMEGLENVLHALTRGARLCLEDGCQLETADDDVSFVVAQGGLMTALRLDGLRQRLDEDTLDRLVADVAVALTPALSRSAHAVQAVLERDPDRTPRELERLFAPVRRAAKRLGLGLDAILDDTQARLLATCSSERAWLTVWTHPHALTRPEKRQARQHYFKSLSRLTPPHPPLEGQNVGVLYRSLRETHAAVVATLARDLDACGLFLQPVDGHTFLHELRGSLEPLTTDGWRAVLPGDPIPRRAWGRKRDLSELWYPRIGYQLCESVIERPAREGVVRMGERWLASASMELGPHDLREFALLFAQLDRALPVRIAFQLDGGFEHWGLRRVLADFWAFSSEYNRRISDAFSAIEATQRQEPTPRLRVCATTWGPDEPSARARIARLRATLETWGAQQWRVERGDPALAVLASLPGFALDLTPGEPHAAPLSDAVRLLPLTRPALPWDQGSVLFRSDDGKILPFQPGSELQTYWITLYAGSLGSGKSLTMHHDNLAYLLGGEREIPYLSIIEPGASSQGLIELCQAEMPPNRQALFVYRRLRQVAADAINPLDLQLGMRDLLPSERAFVRNFLTALATPAGETTAPPGVAELVAEVVADLYPAFADNAHGHPKLYEPRRDVRVDGALAEHGLAADTQTPWFHLVDRLFAAGDRVNAHRAQRFAAPLLNDGIAFLAQSEGIRKVWGPVAVTDRGPLIEFVIRQWTHALRVFPLLSAPTAVELRGARVIALDVEEIATRGGPFSAWEASISYMLARHVAATHFYLHESYVKDWPELYQAYQRQRILELRSHHKRLCLDEVHRLKGGAPATMAQLETDALESRKNGVEISLCSQMFDHFPETILQNASARIILGASEEEGNHLAERFGLNPAERQAMRQHLHGPTPDGAPLLLSVDTTRGRFTQLVYLTTGVQERWALTTVEQDRALRQRVMERLPARAARRALARRFPSGSCVAELRDRTERLEGERGQVITGEDRQGLIQELADEVIAAAGAETGVH
ncbi:MAG: hypothetical protein IPL99_08785 [Candidatus Competibacteraceae bacterium]|nr:hypothetical protein [Candidatus Competibacteraceae bacterium]